MPGLKPAFVYRSYTVIHTVSTHDKLFIALKMFSRFRVHAPHNLSAFHHVGDEGIFLFKSSIH